MQTADKEIAVDTETCWDTNILMQKAFIATTTDQQLQSILYEVRDKKDELVKLKEICESTEIRKVFHNAAYDITCLHHNGINVVPPYDDTMVMAALINENFSSKKLKSLAKEYLNEQCLEEAELKKVIAKLKRNSGASYDFSYDQIPPEVLYPYAKKDTEYTMKLNYLFKNPLQRFKKIYDMEMELIPIIVEMQLNGMTIDRDFLVDRIIKFGTERQEVKQRAIDEVKKMGIKFYAKKGTKKVECEFNPMSVAHLRVIWIHLQLPVIEKTEKGEISTNSKVLKEFLENEENFEKYNIEVIKHIARFRFIHKQLATYAVPLYDHYTSETNNRAHFHLWQSGAKTGRFSAELIQTMPRIDHDKGIEDVRMIRFSFVPKPNHVLVFIDYDQIEMRIFAHFSDSQLLIKDLNNGFDPHMGTVYNIFDKELIDSNPIIRDTFRSMIKAINFGIMYGMGVKALTFKIKDMIYRAAHVNPEVRHKFEEILRDIPGVLRKYYEKYPADVYQRELISSLYKKGYVEIEFNSELMNFSRIYTVPKRMAYKAVNMVVQGSAAYVMKTGMIRAYNWIKKEAPWIKLCMTVHDELIFEMPKDKPFVAASLKLQELMSDKVTFKIPIVASIKATEKSWGDAFGLAVDGKCKKHGQLPEPIEGSFNIVYCKDCKKKYYVVPSQNPADWEGKWS
jgi:DNA polymerase-1